MARLAKTYHSLGNATEAAKLENFIPDNNKSSST